MEIESKWRGIDKVQTKELERLSQEKKQKEVEEQKEAVRKRSYELYLELKKEYEDPNMRSIRL